MKGNTMDLTGRIVLYRISDELVRPAIVTTVHSAECLTLQVFLDGFENPDCEPGLMLETSVVNGPGIGQWEGLPVETLNIENITGTLLPIPPTEPKAGVLVHANAADVTGYVMFVDDVQPLEFIKQLKAQFEKFIGLPILVVCGTKGSLSPVVGSDDEAKPE